jgi:GTP-binding protein
MIETFLSKRETLKGVVVIMDIRRTPGTEERDLIRWLDYYKIASILVITKADKLSMVKQDLILFSAKTRLGRDAVWEAILALLKRNNLS